MGRVSEHGGLIFLFNGAGDEEPAGVVRGAPKVFRLGWCPWSTSSRKPPELVC
jgi:hypothetical protein